MTGNKIRHKKWKFNTKVLLLYLSEKVSTKNFNVPETSLVLYRKWISTLLYLPYTQAMPKT